jgi:effector-binding domain-containing protein|uniref:AraC effector-binding domain-containing protein n=1 Tax=Globisporangium ultimum (strain ATCC 200006 / CBS 805.95 / DAOM BR144) TaxID=431595 RepID=K3X5B6_GLOUD
MSATITSSTSSSLKDDEAGKVTITSIPQVRVLALRGVVANYRAQTQLWSELTAFCEAHRIAIAGACFTIDYNREYKPKDVDLEVCLPISVETEIPAPEDPSWGKIQERELPAIPKAAVITHLGNYDGLPPVYEMLYKWISDNSHTPNGLVREVYLHMDPCDTTEASCITQVQQPIA